MQRLELEGYTPLWWQTGHEALEGLFTERPDLVICDIVLPDMSGEEVFLQALPRLGSTPFLFVTAHAKIDQAVRLTKAGAVDYLEKPYEMIDLLERIAELIAVRPQSSGVLGASEAMRQVDVPRSAKLGSLKRGYEQHRAAMRFPFLTNVLNGDIEAAIDALEYTTDQTRAELWGDLTAPLDARNR